MAAFLSYAPQMMVMLGIFGVIYAIWIYIRQWVGEIYVQANHLEYLLFIAAMVGFLMISIVNNTGGTGLSQEATFWLYVVSAAGAVIAGITHLLRIVRDK